MARHHPRGGRRLQPLCSTSTRHSVPTSGTDKLRQIFLARPFGISWCRGTDSTAPVAGFVHNE